MYITFYNAYFMCKLILLVRMLGIVIRLNLIVFLVSCYLLLCRMWARGNPPLSLHFPTFYSIF